MTLHVKPSFDEIIAAAQAESDREKFKRDFRNVVRRLHATYRTPHLIAEALLETYHITERKE
jgi:hypothetical protein